MEKYTVTDAPKIKGKMLIKRQSDGLVARCKMSYLIPYGDTGFYVRKSETKSTRLNGLDWATEE